MISMTFSSTVENIERAVLYTSDFVARLKKSIDTFGLRLVLSEGITNAIVHGNKENAAKPVSVKIKLTETRITISVKDTGGGFDWRSRVTEGMPEFDSPRGRGVALMQAYGYEVQFNDKGNILTLTRKLDPHPDEPNQ
ncbi:MAG: ATP-binding protein [Chitinivibrionales bacterium]|nr:ATP-binding protein [Chitinivibrionales bacterium]MBD3358936.1 ATP-binding protein [Chitinivibrionales bacterium]